MVGRLLTDGCTHTVETDDMETDMEMQTHVPLSTAPGMGRKERSRRRGWEKIARNVKLNHVLFLLSGFRLLTIYSEQILVRMPLA